MKLTLEERKALAAVREPASVYSKALWQILKRLADRDLCETGAPLEYQRLDPERCPLGIAVISPAGKRALREDYHRRPDRSSVARKLEVAHACA